MTTYGEYNRNSIVAGGNTRGGYALKALTPFSLVRAFLVFQRGYNVKTGYKNATNGSRRNSVQVVDKRALQQSNLEILLIYKVAMNTKPGSK